MELKQKGIFKVNVLYKLDAEGLSSGHWVLAYDEADALRVANIYCIGNPMGISDIRRREVNTHAEFNSKRRYRGKVWSEAKGKLYYFETPLADQTELKEFEGEDRFTVSDVNSIDEIIKGVDLE